MSRFGFSFGRDNKKNNRRERDDIVLRHEPSSGHNNYSEDEDDNAYYDPRDPRLMMRPYRTDDARSDRGTRQRAHEDDDVPTGFRRQNVSHDDAHTGYSQRDEYAPSQNYSRERADPSFDQRQRSSYDRQPQRENIKELGFWHNEEADAQYDDSEVEADQPSPLKFIVAVTALIFICTVTWLAYRWISLPTSDTPPLIQAETDPYRVRPENPGGTDFPHQDKLIYGRLAQNADQPVERLLPPPEQPIIMAPTYTQAQPQGQLPAQQQPQPHGQYPAQSDQVQPSQGQPGYYQPPYPQQPQGHIQGQPMPAQQQAYAPGYEPANQPGQMPNQAPVHMQNQVPVQGHEVQHYPGQPYPAQHYQNPQHAQHEQNQPQAPDLNALPQYQHQQNQKQMAQNPATRMENPVEAQQNTAATSLDTVVNTPEEKVAPADTTSYFLQLGTLISEPLAKKERERLQKRYARELTGMDLNIKSFISSDGRKKYRIIAGPTIVSRKAALEKCANLGNCSPVRN